MNSTIKATVWLADWCLCLVIYSVLVIMIVSLVYVLC